MILRELRGCLRLTPILATLAMVGIPVCWGIDRVQDSVLRDNFDVMTQFLISPSSLLAPLAAVAVGCSATAAELRHRYISNTRSRVHPAATIRAKLAAAALGSGTAFFLYAFVPFLIAYLVWPEIGNPGIDPAAYLMTPEQAQSDSLTRSAYSQLLQAGPVTYGVVYSLWVAFGGAVLGCLGLLALIFVRSLSLAVATPFLVYFGQSVLAAVVGEPQAALAYSLVPFGLTQIPIGRSALPMLILAAATTLLWTLLWRRIPYSPRLS